MGMRKKLAVELVDQHQLDTKVHLENVQSTAARLVQLMERLRIGPNRAEVLAMEAGASAASAASAASGGVQSSVCETVVYNLHRALADAELARATLGIERKRHDEQLEQRVETWRIRMKKQLDELREELEAELKRKETALRSELEDEQQKVERPLSYQQGSIALVIPNVDVGANACEHPHRLRVITKGSLQECRAAINIPSVQVGAGVRKHRQHIQKSFGGSGKDRRLTV
jgi:hypothetical protein